jgi:L-lysine exporter family protein LysE/ArgO
MSSLLAGFAFGLSLIVAIGAQNAFVLRIGLTRRHVAAVVAVCALSDVVLIGAGVAGLGALVDRHPAVLVVARVAGAAFLVGYAGLAIRRAIRPAVLAVDEERPATGPAGALGTALALTWLNPHVYLDTVVLLGSVAAGHGELRWWFGAGAMLGSLVWFTALGYGARLLTPLFARPRAWRVLDGVIAAVMLAIAAGLLWGLRG